MCDKHSISHLRSPPWSGPGRRRLWMYELPDCFRFPFLSLKLFDSFRIKFSQKALNWLRLLGEQKLSRLIYSQTTTSEHMTLFILFVTYNNPALLFTQSKFFITLRYFIFRARSNFLSELSLRDSFNRAFVESLGTSRNSGEATSKNWGISVIFMSSNFEQLSRASFDWAMNLLRHASVAWIRGILTTDFGWGPTQF